MLMLWLMRAHFHAGSDRPSVWQGARALVAACLFTMVYGVSGFLLLDRHYSVHFGFWAALNQALVMFTQFYDPGLIPLTRFGRFFAELNLYGRRCDAWLCRLDAAAARLFP